MNLQFGLRGADIARREIGIVSWLNFRDPMRGKELGGLYGELVTDPYAHQVGMLTQLALKNLVVRGTVRPTDLVDRGLGYRAYSLVDRSAAGDVDPATVELTPREMALMGFLDVRRGKAQTAAELDERLGLDKQAELPHAWRTEACLGHLASLQLVVAVANPPDAYRLPQPD